MALSSFKSKISLLFFLTLLVACSPVQTLNDWSDSAINAEINKYFTLTYEQRKQTKELVRKHLHSIVRKRYTLVKSYLDQAIEIVNTKDLAENDFNLFYERGASIYRQLFSDLSPAASDFAKILKEDQLADFTVKMKTKALIYYGKHELKNQFSTWFDLVDLELTEKQKDKFNNFIDDTSYPFEKERADRIALCEEFSKLKYKKRGLGKFVADFFAGRAKPEESSYIEQVKKFLLSFLNSLSDDQRRDVVKRINDFKEDLKFLKENKDEE